MKKNDTFLEKLDRVLSPIGNKLGNQIHLKAISTGMMFGLPFIVVGSLFLIFANPPINLELYNPETANFFVRFLASWKEFAVANYDLLTAPYNMTMGIFGLICAFGIAYSLARDYQLNAAMNGMMSVSIFMLVAANSVEGQISTEFLGTNGLFVAIIIGLIVVEVTRMIDRLNWKITMPDSVPTAVTAFVNSLLPLLFNIILIYGANLIIIALTGSTFPEFIMSILTPALGFAGNLWGFIAIVTFGNFLWLFGINGSSIIFPILFSIGIANTGINSELVANGQQPDVAMNLQMFRISVLGGAGGTLGLIILMMRSKLTHLKTLSKISIVPGICGINEPIIFGLPIVFNPILAIPFLITPIINLVLTYYAQLSGIISMGYIIDPSFTPFFAQAYLATMDFRNILFYCGLIILSIFIYYPFFKIYEGGLSREELVHN
ncbi:PTS transporter subunit EIIC [Carnobacterium sp.]|uniref:PTS sugar transporter subunit IIC n=1 Tax=Carnobacterium sp. TaxID=48221 RepID=UPI0028AD13F2|nr:PTS transporter subunit EIIC [Carnobacterium sp.]